MISKLIITTAVLVEILSLKVLANEDTWATAQVQINENTRVSGFMTDSGKFRISELPQIDSSMQISGGYFKDARGNSKTLCTNLDTSLQATRLLSKNKYVLKSLVYPFAANLTRNFPVAIENIPQFGNVSVTLKRNMNSIVTPISASDFETKLNKLISSQSEKIKTIGEFEIELGQIDDVACDLILGGSTLVVNLGVILEAAKHERIITLSGTEFSKIYEDIKSRQVNLVSPQARAVVNGGLLDQALRLHIGKGIEEYGADRFVKIASIVFNLETNLVKNIPSSRYDAEAATLDVLKTNSSLVYLKVLTDAIVGEK